jgi:rhodanese-related sulfurtransferase
VKKWAQVLFGRCGDQQAPELVASIPQVDPLTLWSQMEEAPAPLLVDVRLAAEYEAEHIAGARLLPQPVLLERCDELPRDRLLVLVCRGGATSQATCEQLARNGFRQLANLRGGMQAWKEAGLPYVVTGCSSAMREAATTTGEGMVTATTSSH